MMKPKILRVWGKADSFDIEFTHEGGTRWKCSVPPDTKDGQYAAEIWAINELGEFAYWTGELFMCNGVCCLRFDESPYRIWVKLSSAEISEIFETVGIRIKMDERRVLFNLTPLTQIEVRKGCANVSM